MPRKSRLYSLLRLLFGPLTAKPWVRRIIGDKRPRPDARGKAPWVSLHFLKKRARQHGVTPGPQQFALLRIVGNDLPMRHADNQSYNNLRYLLLNEPDFSDCSKYWLLNRIVDRKKEQQLIALLEEHQQEYFRLPYVEDEFLGQPLDLGCLPYVGYTCSQDFHELPQDYQERLLLRVLRYRSNYAINNNGARNSALAYGKQRARWVLPWDGNCYLTDHAWNQLSQSVSSEPWYPYVIVPMLRLESYEELENETLPDFANQEPQIIFRSDAQQEFSTEYYYGRRPKVELLWRLGVPGPWDSWAIEPWDLPVPEYCKEAGFWKQTGCVYRLPSSNTQAQKPDTSADTSARDRLAKRTRGVLLFLSSTWYKAVYEQPSITEHPDIRAYLRHLRSSFIPARNSSEESIQHARHMLSLLVALPDLLVQFPENPDSKIRLYWILRPSRAILQECMEWLDEDSAIQTLSRGTDHWTLQIRLLALLLPFCLGDAFRFQRAYIQARDWLRLPEIEALQDSRDYYYLECFMDLF